MATIRTLERRPSRDAETSDRQALQRSERRLRDAQRLGGLGDWDWDPLTDSVTWSENLYRIFGLDPNQPPPNYQGQLALYHPEDAERLHQAVTRALDDGTPYHLELRRRLADGRERWLKVKGVAERDAAGRVIRLRGSALDITDLKLAENARWESEARFTLAYRNSQVAMALLDTDGRFLDVNDAACRMVGRRRRELLGASILDITHPLDREQCVQHYQRYVEQDLDGYDCDARYLTKDGEIRWGMLVVSKVRNAAGEFLYSVTQTMDLTPLKQAHEALLKAKEQAESADRAKSEFLANMSHEIRTPLNGVQGMLQLMQDLDPEPTMAECIEIAMESSQSLLRIINDVLDLSKIEAGKLSIQPEPLALESLLRTVIASFAHQTRSKNLQLHSRIAPATPTAVIGDATRLHQVLFNLVGNAVKFTDQGEVRVEVSVLERLDDERVRLRFSVSDTGIGIPAAMLGELFKPFTQVDSSSRRRFQGTGLGLAIVKRLADLMDGQVSIASEPGRGTQVCFDLPMAIFSLETTSDACAAPAPAPATTQNASTKSLRVLVVDDDQASIRVLAMALEQWGHVVRTAMNGREAIDSFAEQPLDLVLMDVRMPEMDGLAATRHIRVKEAEQQRSPARIIALTAQAFQEDREKCLAAGMDDYLSKPIDTEKLRMAITA
jgi:PAS domain S-box-containing protein